MFQIKLAALLKPAHHIKEAAAIVRKVFTIRSSQRFESPHCLETIQNAQTVDGARVCEVINHIFVLQ